MQSNFLLVYVLAKPEESETAALTYNKVASSHITCPEIRPRADIYGKGIRKWFFMWWVLPVYTLTVSGSVLEAKYSLFSQSSYSWTQHRMPSLYVDDGLPAQLICFYVSMSHYHTAAQPTPCNVLFVSERQCQCAAVHQQFSPGAMTSFGRTVQKPPEISESPTTISPLGAIPDVVQCGARWTQKPLPTTATLWLELSNYMPLSCPHLPAHSLLVFLSCLLPFSPGQ